MAEIVVGIRDLKARLSAYLEQAQQGQTIVITSHGKPIAQITPRKEELLERIKALQAAGMIQWNGKRPRHRVPSVANTSEKLVSDLAVELRK